MPYRSATQAQGPLGRQTLNAGFRCRGRPGLHTRSRAPHQAQLHQPPRDPQWRQGQEWGDARRERTGSQCRAVSVPEHGSCSPPTNRAARDDCAARPGSRLRSLREPVSDVVVVLVSPKDDNRIDVVFLSVQVRDIDGASLHELAQQCVLVHVQEKPALERTA